MSPSDPDAAATEGIPAPQPTPPAEPTAWIAPAESTAPTPSAEPTAPTPSAEPTGPELVAPADGVPAPPPGPGVRPPFVSPPTDGTRRRRWIAAGITGAVVLMCCVGGLVGLGGLAVLGSQMILADARNAVTQYLTAVRDEQYDTAYDLLCDIQRNRFTVTEFTESFDDSPNLDSFEVGQPEAQNILVVPATLHFRGEADDEVRFRMDQDQDTGKFKVCGVEG